MAKKNFTIRYKEPEIKGTNKSLITDKKGTDESQNEISDASEFLDNADEREKESPAEIIKRVISKPKDDPPPLKDKLTFAELDSDRSPANKNPFLQTRESFDPSSVIKTGYKMRVEYKQVLKLLAEMKKGYTIEALLDEALTKYFDNTPEAQNALRMMKMLK